MKKLLFILIFSLVLTGCNKQDSVFGGDDISIEKEIDLTEYVTAPENNSYKMGEKNYETEYKEIISDKNSLNYRIGDKKFSMTPISMSGEKEVMSDSELLGAVSLSENIKEILPISKDIEKKEWKGVFGEGVSINIKESERKWEKIVKFKTLKDIKNYIDGDFIKLEFEIKSNFIIDGWDRKSEIEIKDKIRLGDKSYLNQSSVWDSSKIETIDDDGVISVSNRSSKIKTTLSNNSGKLILTKYIPTSFIKESIFPIYTDADITYGTEYEFDASAKGIKVVKLSENKFVIAYIDDADSDTGKAVVGTISGTTISYGSLYEFNQEVFFTNMGLCLIGTDKIAIAYTDDNDSDVGKTIVGTISGTVITFGTEATFSGANDAEHISCSKLDTDKYLISYNSETNSDTATGNVASVSGTTITVYDKVDFALTDYYPKHIDSIELTTDKVVVVFYSANNYNSYALIASVSGTTLTFGTPSAFAIEILANRATYITVDSFNSSEIVISYRGYDTASNFSSLIGIVSGTSVTYGTIDEYAGFVPYSNDTIVINDTSYLTIAGSTDGTESFYNIADLDANSVTIGTKENINASAYNIVGGALSSCLISTDTILLCMQDSTDASRGICILGEAPSTPSADTCTYSGSGNWNVNYSDNCYVTSETYVKGDFNLIASTTGSFNLQATLIVDDLNAGAGSSISAENSTAEIQIY